MRVIGYSAAGKVEFRHAGRAVKNAPISAHRAFQRAFPRLIEGLDDIDPEILALRQRQRLGNGARLVRRRRPRAFAHAAGARPTELADDNLLVRDSSGDFGTDGGDVGGRVRSRYRKVLPVRQDVDSDKIDRALDVGITQPVFPNVGVGNRHGNLRLDLANNCNQVRRRHFAAQQHFIADDHRRDHVRIGFGERDRSRDLPAGFFRVVGNPDPVQHLQSVPPGAFQHAVEAVVDRIGAHAAGIFGQEREILVDLPRLDARTFDQRVLPAAKRRVGDAIELFAGGSPGRRQLNGRAEPPPHGANCQRRDRKKAKRRTDCRGVSRAGHPLPLTSRPPDAKIDARS